MKITIMDLLLLQVGVETLLYENVQTKVNRKMKFKIKYKFVKLLELLNSSLKPYEEERVEIIKKYGEEDENGVLKVTQENLPKFYEEMEERLKTEIDLDLTGKTFTEEDLDSIPGDIEIDVKVVEAIDKYLIEG